MELSTFGAIMKFAMDRERDIADIALSAGTNEALSPFRELTERIMSDSKKTAQLLERTRREGINEVILHPVAGLESDNYRFQDRSTAQLAAREFGEYLTDTFERIAGFYTDAALKVSNPGAARAFKQLAIQRLKLRDEIKEHASRLK